MAAVDFRWSRQRDEKLKVNVKDEVVYLSFPAFEAFEGLVHGFSTRQGGVSEGDCASMNLSFARGDQREAVLKNYRIISESMGFSCESIVCSDQTHTTNIRKVGLEDCGNGISKPKPYRDVDGLITDVPGVTLATFYADCVPLYLFDPVRRAIGLSHSGWRGTVGKIGQATVEAMTVAYGSDPADIIAAIGPSICRDCYEVSADVAEQFHLAFDEADRRRMLIDKGNGKFQLDLWTACETVFIEAGIRSEHITKPNLCTCCNPDKLFSHRASKGKRGNLAAFLGLI